MRKNRRTFLLMLLAAFALLFTSAAALADGPDDAVCNAPGAAAKLVIRAENEENEETGQDAEPTPTPVPDAVDVLFNKGEYALLGEDGAVLATIKITEDGGSTGTVAAAEDSGAMEGSATVQFLQESSKLLLQTVDEEGTTTFFVPVRVSITDAGQEESWFDARVEKQSIINFDELLLQYQAWHPALPAETPEAEPTVSPEPTTEPADSAGNAFDSEVTSSANEQTDGGGISELLKLIGIGVCILIGAAILTAVIMQTTKVTDELFEITDSIRERRKAEEGKAARLDNMITLANRRLEHLVAIEKRLDIGVKVQTETRPIEDPLKTFQEKANDLATVDEPEKWLRALAAYRPAFLKYDTIQNWFYNADSGEQPPFAACMVTSGNAQTLCLIPSCYNAGLSANIAPAYDLLEPGDRTASIKRYRIDRLATLEPYGAYYRVKSRGQISLIT